MQSKGLRLRELSKIYFDQHGREFLAVNRIDVDIHPGEFVTMLGPSGCGKTTTLRMIAGFEIPTGGSITLDEQDITQLTPDKRDTAMVFQSYALFPHLSVFDNIGYGLKLKRMSRQEINKKVFDIIDLVGLNDLQNRHPNQLSGGQQQRVALARALVMEPGVLLFDEPLSNLDAKLRVYMRQEIRRIQRSIGITAVYVTHDQSEAMSLSDRIIIMNGGIIEQMGTPQQIYSRPRTRFVADFIGTANFLPGTILAREGERAVIRVAGQADLSVEYAGGHGVGDSLTAMIRPEAIRIGSQGKLHGKVISSTYMGSYQDYRIQVADQEVYVEYPNPSGRQVFGPGEELSLDFDLENVHPLD